MENYYQEIELSEWIEKYLPSYLDTIIFTLKTKQIKFEDWISYIKIINRLIELNFINQEKIIILIQAVKEAIIKISSEIEHAIYLSNIKDLDSLINSFSLNQNQLTR